ncbi:helix-turn-helix transcriptional regulator [Pseudomonas asuensis]|uniref:DNA-binding protein n=1 Tax=Pseudomonas asuensis TaxID=1825787 RepID=A0ABQ2H1U5_9PSED|nr:AlpA family transcriptional regulator [Pseudomonas asuensis]GGM23607.1 DNA-binding protein [Pseudomonas asuensis]
MRIIRLKEVMETTGLARSTVYKYISEGIFPKPVSLGERCVGWVESEVQEWILARIEERDLAKESLLGP